MDKPKEISRFELKLVFHNISYLIDHKEKNISKNHDYYLKQAVEYFESGKKSLDSMINFKSSEGYFITPHFSEVILPVLKNNKESDSTAIIKNVKQKIEKILTSLNKLKEDPNEFYKTPESKEISDYAKKFSLKTNEYF